MAYKDPLDPRARAARRKHYYANKEHYYARNNAHREEIRIYIRNLKSVTPCEDCDMKYPYYVMDFDHLPGEQKLFDLSRAGRATWKQLLAEIKKCDLVCSNCHRIRTHNRRCVA
jgi:hypothetical protein